MPNPYEEDQLYPNDGGLLNEDSEQTKARIEEKNDVVKELPIIEQVFDILSQWVIRYSDITQIDDTFSAEKIAIEVSSSKKAAIALQDDMDFLRQLVNEHVRDKG